MKTIRISGTISEKTAAEIAAAQAVKNEANIDYLAMMLDVDMDDGEDMADEQEV